MNSYEVIIGLEIHAQLSTTTKAWCGCEISTKAYENSKVCEICSAQPGTLPFLNSQAVNYALAACMALNCKINKYCKFDRKNYFYPDLPKGYQITQFDMPIGLDGFIQITDENEKNKKIGIERIQMEEDTGKSMHMGESSLINLNRSGTPLTDISSAKEASSYFKKMQSILVYLGICHGNMQDGNLRCDVNLSLRKKGEKKFGTRTEVKNLNSFRSVERAVEYETTRQTALLNKGEKIEQQTLLFDVETGQTRVLRTKSNADDYRYFPEPDLMPLVIEEKLIEKIKNNLPELPDQKVTRFLKDYSIPLYDAEVLTADKALANYFEKAVSHYKSEPKKIANWVMVELLKLLNESGISVEQSPVKPEELASLLTFVHEGKISGKQAKDVFLYMYDKKASASNAIATLGISQISDSSELDAVINSVIDSNPEELKRYVEGAQKLFGFFVGQVMKATKGQANPQMVNEILRKELDKRK